MFSIKKSSSNPRPAKSSARGSQVSSDNKTAKKQNRRRSASDILVSKPIFGRRKSDDAGVRSPTKRSFFRMRSKDRQTCEKTPESPLLPGMPEKNKEQKITLEELSKIEPILEASQPMAIPCQAHSEPNHMPMSILELSESPKRVTQINEHEYDKYSDSHGRLSATPSLGSTDEELVYKCPSSPLLVAVRTAVDSLSQYDDFDILEKIGSGFYAEVFKVRCISHCIVLPYMYINGD